VTSNFCFVLTFGS